MYSSVVFLGVPIAILVTSLYVLYCANQYRKQHSADDKAHEEFMERVSLGSAIAAIAISIITIIVMVDQNKTQQFLIDMQKSEHQPSFEVQYGRYNLDDVAFEEFCVSNQGEPFKQVKVSKETYIEVEHFSTNPDANFKTYIFVPDYYASGHNTGAVLGDIYKTTHSHLTKNVESLESWRVQTRAYNEAHNGHIYLMMKSFVVIEYKDIYGDERKEYFLDGKLCTEDSYNNVRSIWQRDFDSQYHYIANIKFPDVLMANESFAAALNTDK